MKPKGAVYFINQFLFLPLLAGYRLFLGGLFALFGFFGLALRLGMRFNRAVFFIGNIIFSDGIDGK
jgi:hypothetical protein